ncbi:Alkaline phosphatase synthesis sensor protein PhoR [compost metagenome]
MEGNRTLLEQVWINLLSNAIKYTPESGKIEIRGISEAEGVIISIADNGIGMGREAIERIFERFYKADDSRNRNVEGNGLGLSIVRLIVQLHYGSVEVVSQPNIGSTFTVYLPKRQHKQRFLSSS